MTAEQGSTRETAISRNGERAADPAAAAAAAADDGGDGKRWIVFVMGATASGKTGMAQFLAKTLDAKFIEGDDVGTLWPLSFHPPSATDVQRTPC